MRLVRLGPETANVGVDLRAALASWGPGDAIVGGVALLGVTPVGCPGPVDAVILLPRGIIVVVGVDLPDPAVKLDAPLAGPWRTDGWPLVRPDGAVNPAASPLAAAAAVTNALRTAPVPVCTLVAVGPYVGEVTQPPTDPHRVLHPGPRSLLAAVRELAVAPELCSVDEARRLLTGLVGDRVRMLIGELAAEGFADTVTPDVASATTADLPRITDRAPSGGRGLGRRLREWRSESRWLPMSALGLAAALLIAGIAVAVGTGEGPTPTAVASTAGTPGIQVDGFVFTSKGSDIDVDCAEHAFGELGSWLTAGHACLRLNRWVFRTSVGGRPAAVALTMVDFRDPANAGEFAALATKPGTGGITDLVSDGAAWPDGPRYFASGARDVVARDAAVLLAQAVWLGRPSNPADPALVRMAAAAVAGPTDH